MTCVRLNDNLPQAEHFPQQGDRQPERPLVTIERPLVTKERPPVTRERPLVIRERTLVTRERPLVTRRRETSSDQRETSSDRHLRLPKRYRSILGQVNAPVHHSERESPKRLHDHGQPNGVRRQGIPQSGSGDSGTMSVEHETGPATWVAEGHRLEDFVKQLEWSVQLDLDPAGRLFDCRPRIVGSPALDEAELKNAQAS